MSYILTSIKGFALSLALLTTACMAHPVPASAADQPAAEKEAKAKPYPLDHCVVSGDKFGGDMGDAITKTYKGQEIKFCCKDCIKDFDKDPDKVLAKVQAEAAKQPAATDKKDAAPAKAADPAKH